MRHQSISNYFDGRIHKKHDHDKHHDKHHDKYHGKHHDCHKNYQIPKVKITEEIKVASIRDVFDNLRYKVAMTSYDVYGFDGNTKAYQVEVVNCFSAPDDLIIVSRPDDREPLIFDRNYAKKLYDDYVKSYSNLVKAETRDLQDMSVYADKVGYTLTCPKCCVTCKWACRRVVKNGHYDWTHKSTGRLECRNPLNQKEYQLPNIESNKQPYPVCTQPPYCNKDGSTPVVLYPKVQAFGLCYNYQKREAQFVPMPGQDMMEYIDNRISGMIDAGIETSIKDTVPEMVENEVNIAINKKIPDMIETEVEEAMEDQIDKTLDAVDKQIQDHLINNPPVIDGNYGLEDDLIEEVVLISDGAL